MAKYSFVVEFTDKNDKFRSVEQAATWFRGLLQSIARLLPGGVLLVDIHIRHSELKVEKALERSRQTRLSV